jgi:hypothetical protein
MATFGRALALMFHGEALLGSARSFAPLTGSLGNQYIARGLVRRGQFVGYWRRMMKTLAIALLAGAAALSAGSARASDVYVSDGYANPDLVQQVRLVCDESGNCYRTRGGARVIVRDSYNYAPRERYYERRTYRDYDDGPRAGVGIRTPGVSVGVGVGSDRW